MAGIFLELPVTIPQLAQIEAKLDTLIQLLTAAALKEDHMSQELDDLTAAVAENTALDLSAIELINGLASQILELKDDPVKLATLAGDLRAKSAALAAAIQANTPQLPVTP